MNYVLYYKCLIPGECKITTTKPTYFGFFIRYNFALGLFRKKGNVLVRISMSLIIIISSSFRRHLAENFFLIFFVGIFYSFFLYLLFHQLKQILLRIYLEYLGKTNKQTNKAKQKEANSVYFSSITLRITPHFSVYLCLLLFFI